jgi:hypothetical protein
MLGQRLESLQINDLQNLEVQLESGLARVRTRKVRLWIYVPIFYISTYVHLPFLKCVDGIDNGAAPSFSSAGA